MHCRRRHLAFLWAAVVVASGRADAVNLNPAGAAPLQSHRYFATASPDALGPGSLWFGTAAGFAHAPLTCRLRGEQGIAAGFAATATSLFGGAISDWLHISLAIPAMVVDASWTPTTKFCPAPDLASSGLFWGVNDPILHAAVFLWSSHESSFALRATATLPVMGFVGLIQPELAPVADVLGDDWGALKITANPGSVMGPVSVAAELGVIVRPSSAVLDRWLGSGLVASSGASVHIFWPGLFFIGDVNARLFGNLGGFAPFLFSTDISMPAEAMAGIKYRYGEWGFTAGVGTSMNAGPTTSDARVLASISYGGPKTLAEGPPLLDLRFLIAPTLLIESSEDVEIARRRGERREHAKKRKRKHRVPPCPDYESLSDEEKLFLDPDCVPAIFDEDPYADIGIDELMCEEVIEKTMQECKAQPQIIERVMQVKFAIGATHLDSADAARLKRAIESIPARTTLVSAVVIGHADSLGTSHFNEALAEERAHQVRDQLVASGVAAASVEVLARGEEDPLVSNLDVPHGTPANRRVDIVLRFLQAAVVTPAPEPPPAVIVEKPKPKPTRRVLQLEPIERSSAR